ncbi:hypothetical protein BT96DRAFT_950770 [Gymnopus androsaceus JB14]|uniref:Uncharacterized protein n=1 Tax=Gymnopus androsaceus JB14 TaxID=1447944 RepID=A0A6A4GF23_9AGAR|nr:hypothetical protein BT96DRAFT_950770 [Gymnopus androsaceus JB14]
MAAQKFDKRTEGVAMVLSQPNLSASDRRKWEKVEFALCQLGAQGQSSEESDAESMEHQLNVTVPYFQKSKELQKHQAKQTEESQSLDPWAKTLQTDSDTGDEQ